MGGWVGDSWGVRNGGEDVGRGVGIGDNDCWSAETGDDKGESVGVGTC